MALEHFSVEDYDIGMEESSQSLLDKTPHPPVHRTLYQRLFENPYHFLAFQAVLIMFYTATLIIYISRQGVSTESSVYSPARDAIKYHRVRFNATLVIDSPYNGEPSPELDTAWRDLLQYMNIAVPKSDLDKIGADSISVPDEQDHYVAGLSVFHELHCLKRIHQYTWQDHYFPNLTADEKRLNRLHTDHCIDVLRQASMCHSDISLFTLQWAEKQAMPRADFSHEHSCADWGELIKWAAKRSIPEEKMKRLKHPIYGPAFPDGHGSSLGATEDMSPQVHE